MRERTSLSNLLLDLLKHTSQSLLQLPRPLLQIAPGRLRLFLWLIRLVLRRSVYLLMDTIIRHQRLRVARAGILVLRESAWRRDMWLWWRRTGHAW